uniref:Coatomer subunit zeta n=1 Tax=Schistocephalus solidus TaxID=70667 RepID=A0A0X3P8C4_SCHSO
MPAVREPTLYAIKAILILDSDGKRILAKYYDNTFPTLKAQLDFEKKLFSKTNKTSYAEITLFEGANCVHRSSSDIFFYVIGDANENELILMSALTCLHDSISHILRGNIEKKPLMDNLDLVFLAVDELCDGGIILECDSTALASRVGFKSEDMSISEQTMSQALQAAKEQLKMSLLRG